MRNLAFIIYLLTAVTTGYSAQLKTDSTGKKLNERFFSAKVGTTGIGLYYNQIVSSSNRLVARFGGQYMSYDKMVRVKTAPDSYIIIDPEFTIGIAEANLKWYPLSRSSFFLTAGAGYTWHPSIGFVIKATNKLNLGGLELSPEDVGTVDLGFRWHSIVGYTGLGFCRMIPGNRLNVGFEMGLYYLGRPRVQLTYEGFLETTNIDEQVPVVERNLSNYRFLPSINVTLSYALKRAR